MSQILTLQQQAIKAAKQQDWEAAVSYNKELLQLKPQDTSALNRLGAAYLQLNNTTQAKKAYQQVLKIDRSNKLANKSLERIATNQTHPQPNFSNEHFIEEPGKTKTIELYRLAGKEVLEGLAIGQSCQLEPKSRYISITTEDGVYVGSLPEDISFRLSGLIENGNEYSCYIKSVDHASCFVHIREKHHSQKNQGISSFPINTKGSITTTINEVDESMLDDNIPVEIVNTDSDTERTLEDFDTSEDDD